MCTKPFVVRLGYGDHSITQDAHMSSVSLTPNVTSVFDVALTSSSSANYAGYASSNCFFLTI